MTYISFESDHTSHETGCGCQHPDIPLSALQYEFERVLTEEYCGHLRNAPVTFLDTAENLCKKSTVPGYEAAYFHQHVHYLWLGYRWRAKQVQR